MNTCVIPDGGHSSNFIRQNEVTLADEPLKIQQLLLESSNEMDKLLCVNFFF